MRVTLSVAATLDLALVARFCDAIFFGGLGPTMKHGCDERQNA